MRGRRLGSDEVSVAGSRSNAVAGGEGKPVEAGAGESKHKSLNKHALTTVAHT